MSFAVNPLLEPEDRKAKAEPFPGQLIVAPALGRFWRLFRISVWRAFEHDAFATAKASAYSSILTFFPALLVLGSVLATIRRGEAAYEGDCLVKRQSLQSGSQSARVGDTAIAVDGRRPYGFDALKQALAAVGANYVAQNLAEKSDVGVLSDGGRA